MLTHPESEFVHISADRTVCCPKCNHTIHIANTKRGQGAQYVHDWQQLPKKHIAILCKWLHMDIMRNVPLTKVEARKLLNRYSDIYLTENAASARLSELLGLNLIKIFERESRNKHNDHFTERAPKYVLNIPKCNKVLSAGGRLK